jgi:predicted dehydrogenase
MIRVGIVDFDTSHVVEFTRRLHHVGIAEEQWVDGARVVLGCPGASAILAAERVAEYARVVREELGVPLVERPEEMIGQIDAVLIESVDGSVHAERARPFLAASIPTFIDKPFTCSLAEARQLARLAKEKNVPLFSSSSLRYAPEVTSLAARQGETGAILGVDIYTPGSTHPRNPGLFHYGVHGVEPLYALMGPGCEAVTAVSVEGADVVTGRWRDGRLGTVRAIRAGRSGFGLTAFCERSIETTTIGTGTIYRELLGRIVAMFQSGRPPVPIEESLEIVAFMEAGLESAQSGGAPVSLRSIEEKE